ncbi:hypothetical protein B4Q04_12615, partial [Zobellia sp. OII3]
MHRLLGTLLQTGANYCYFSNLNRIELLTKAKNLCRLKNRPNSMMLSSLVRERVAVWPPSNWPMRASRSRWSRLA